VDGTFEPPCPEQGFLPGICRWRRNASAMIGPSSQTIIPLCRELKKLHLHYKRWLRGSERKALIPAFGDIVASHQPEEQSGFSLYLSFDEGQKSRSGKSMDQ
jgi:hypothetical protein